MIHNSGTNHFQELKDRIDILHAPMDQNISEVSIFCKNYDTKYEVIYYARIKIRDRYRVWGSRCRTGEPDWKYINVRRLFIFIEESIEGGTQWVVFEPNDEPTWARARRSVSKSLTNVWRDGALQGKKPEKAFFARRDRTIITQTDIDNGKPIMETKYCACETCGICHF